MKKNLLFVVCVITTIVMTFSSCTLSKNKNVETSNKNKATSTPTASIKLEDPHIALRKAILKLDQAVTMKSNFKSQNQMGESTTKTIGRIQGDISKNNLYMENTDESIGISMTTKYYVKDGFVYLQEPGNPIYIKISFDTEEELNEILSLEDTSVLFGDVSIDNNPLFTPDNVKRVGEETVKVNNVDIKTNVYELKIPNDISKKYISETFKKSLSALDVGTNPEVTKRIQIICTEITVNMEFLFYISEKGEIVKQSDKTAVNFIGDSKAAIKALEIELDNFVITSSSEYYDIDKNSDIKWPDFNDSNTITYEDYMNESFESDENLQSV